MQERPSLAKRLAAKYGARQLAAMLTPPERQVLEYEWRAWARPLRQVGPRTFIGQETPPGDWITWLVMTGFGWGKTRVGAQWVIEKARTFPGCRIALVGSTAKDARDTMVFGESGIMWKSPPWARPHFRVVEQRLDFPNGSMGFLYSAENPEVFRGPQHHFAWCDEPAKWRRLVEAHRLLMHRLRLGAHPQIVLTTTPKRTVKLLRSLADDPKTVVTKGKTTDNAVNLPKDWLEQRLAELTGTTFGRQELEGELLDDVDGALFLAAWIEQTRLNLSGDGDEVSRALKRVRAFLEGGEIRRIVVGVDPATTSKEESDACGIVVAACGVLDDVAHGFILEDATEKIRPEAWARKVAKLARKWGADCVVAETNLGGETITDLIHMADPNIKVIEKGGNKGKRTRAEPVSALYEKLRVHHVGMFTRLEDELTSFTLDTKKSPNALDAAVYALAELMLREPESGFFLV